MIFQIMAVVASNIVRPPISSTERCISQAVVGASIAVAIPSKQTAWKIRSGSERRCMASCCINEKTLLLIKLKKFPLFYRLM
ncbi:Uncharacterised protein [Salmonella enterica subsp. enterica serovar Bovismorbificans]|nr:Uncharacterised protein [Salmonella enterica subsp. enterica serovar Bovismorbificans]